jgi:outer membrane protein TolC
MSIRFALFAAAVLFAAPAFAQPLSLDEALRIGEAQSPRLAAQRAMSVSASEQVERAGELPDPKVRLGLENLPVTGADRFRYDRDFMTMRSVGVMQDVPNSAKRAARSLRAQRQREVEDANLAAQSVMLRRDIALAWLELYYAEQERAAFEKLAQQYRLQIDTVGPAITRGRQSAADGFMVRQAFEQANDRVIEQKRSIEKARIALASLIGEEAARRPLGAPPDTRNFTHPREHLLQRLAEHPELRVFDDREALARAEVDVAQSTKKPDWSIELAYGQRRPSFDNMITVMLSFELPWQTARRQDRDVASRLAEVTQARALREDARRMHEAEVRRWLTDFDTAAQRIERFETILRPLASARASAALAGYQGGRTELGAVLEADRSVTETEVSLIQMLAERARAWTNLTFLFPQETTQ